MPRTVTRTKARVVSQMGQYEPHPYALLMPPLSDEEYTSLKHSIATMGVKTPVELDEDDRILDGVHRTRIGAELGIDLPVNRNTGLSDDQKLELALGLNLYRRQISGKRRKQIVENLLADGRSVRQIAAVTGWSKSTVHRDAQEVKEAQVALAYLGAQGRDQFAKQTALWMWIETSEPELPMWVRGALRSAGQGHRRGGAGRPGHLRCPSHSLWQPGL